MRDLVVSEWMTLDGVVQGPGYADEDTDGGFTSGGWHLEYFDDVSRSWVVDGYQRAGGLVFGRRTYESLASYWPNAAPEESAVADPLNSLPKYVASTTLTAPLSWNNATLLEGDVIEAVRVLKEDDGAELQVVGSTQLAHALISAGLVDGYRLMVDPVAVSGGKRLFDDSGTLHKLRLVESQVTDTGALLLRYDAARS